MAENDTALMGAGSASGRGGIFLSITAATIIGVFYLWRLWLLNYHGFDPDEFFYLHRAWCESRGMIPYRDFFDHHTPWLFFILAPVFRLYPVDSNPEAAVEFIFLGRRIMMVFTGMGLVLTFVLARLWRGNSVAWIATALLSTSVVFMRKTLEIRPDGLAMVLWLGSLVLTFIAVKDPNVSSRRLWLFGFSGFLLGGAIMTTQKMLLMVPGFTVAMAWYLLGGSGTQRARLAGCLWQLAGFWVPVLATLAFFVAHHALYRFFEYNLVFNLNWPNRFAPWTLLRIAVHWNPAVFVLGSSGLLLEIAREPRTLGFTLNRLLFVITIGALASLVEIPNPFFQYYLTFLPLLAIYAADFLWFTTCELIGPDTQPKSARSKIAIATVLVIAMVCADRLFAPNEAFGPMLCVALFLTAGAALMFRFPEPALALFVIGLSIEPYHYIRKHSMPHMNDQRLHQLRLVLTITRPADTVMDGWSGLGVFRPHAYFYWSLSPRNRFILSSQDRRELLSGLRSGRIAPRLIFPDQDGLGWISPEVELFLLKYYELVPGEFPIFRRKE
ncbi:MAG TPA: glycosyltransferase family 39 protein [Candidatus Binataceae bacterium]|nr:glycosyltransferase family 39 protein [Candidatus Binataceae bacterium]